MSPADGLNTVFQEAFNTPLSIRPWMSQQSTNREYLMNYVRIRGSLPSPSWLDMYPDVEAQTTSWPASQPVFVEINGHTGAQATRFKQKYPHVPGRLILQNIQPILDKISEESASGIEKIAYDFLSVPPVHGAKFYYAQRVFHNLAPQEAQKLLLLIKEAMLPESRLLIDEAVPPETGADYLASAIDLTMLEAFGAVERTESQWRRLLEEVGLELVNTHVYNETIYESIVEVRLQQ